VLEHKGPYPDKSYEYRVQRDAPFLAVGSNEPTGWASYHIDRALPAREAVTA